MTDPTRDALFKPNLTKTESKAEAVSRIAKTLIEQEIEKRDAKTARLKEARLARDAAVPSPQEAKPRTRPTVRKAR